MLESFWTAELAAASRWTSAEIGADELEVYLGVSPRIDGWSEW